MYDVWVITVGKIPWCRLVPSAVEWLHYEPEMGEEKGRDWGEGRKRERFGGGKGEGKIGGGKGEEGREGRGKYLGEGRERERLGGGEGKSERLGRERERLGGGKGEGEEGEEHGVMDIHTCIQYILRGNIFMDLTSLCVMTVHAVGQYANIFPSKYTCCTE